MVERKGDVAVKFYVKVVEDSRAGTQREHRSGLR